MAYATLTELGYAIPSAAVAQVSAQQQQYHLDTATGVADSYMRSRYAVPITSPVPRELAHAVASIAGYDLLCSLGFNPQEFDAVYQERRDRAIEWLKALASGSASLAASADASPSTSEGASAITTSELRGW